MLPATYATNAKNYSTGSTASPLAYSDASLERYAGIDLDYFRTAMTPYRFEVYIDLIGEEAVGLTLEDFEEIYYPDEED